MSLLDANTMSVVRTVACSRDYYDNVELLFAIDSTGKETLSVFSAEDCQVFDVLTGGEGRIFMSVAGAVRKLGRTVPAGNTLLLAYTTRHIPDLAKTKYWCWNLHRSLLRLARSSPRS